MDISLACIYRTHAALTERTVYWRRVFILKPPPLPAPALHSRCNDDRNHAANGARTKRARGQARRTAPRAIRIKYAGAKWREIRTRIFVRVSSVRPVVRFFSRSLSLFLYLLRFFFFFSNAAASLFFT